MASVKIIPAMPQAGKTGSSVKEKPRLRVAAYCRVSTDTEEQATSYQTQVEHYTEYISRNPEWTLAGIYADDGISGTNTKNRVEFNRMMDDCGAGRIDMIITKSISRFARNTLDCLKHIRALKAQNIPVYFEKESINTLDAKGEVLLTIMASLAQQESQSLSQNVKLGLQYRYQQGKVQVNHNRFLGYTKDAEGNLIIDPEQAEIVKRIYREYLEGYSMDRIKAGLERDGIPTGAGKTTWHTSTINKILRNEKYIGDALLQKTYTTDFLNKTRVKNNGIVPQYYVEGNHEPIIPKQLFLKVQDELVRRITCVTANGRKCGFSSRHAFSQIVFCSECGENFHRTQWNNRGKKSVVWRCLTRLYPKKTDSYAMPEPLKRMSSRLHAFLPLTDSGKSGTVFRNRWSVTSKGSLRKTIRARRKSSANGKKSFSRSSSVWLKPGRITAMWFQSFRRYGKNRQNWRTAGTAVMKP